MIKFNWLLSKNKKYILNKDKKFWQALSKKAYPLSNGKLRIPISLEPFLISKKEYGGIENNLKLFISAAKKLAEQYFNDNELQKIISLNSGERDLIKKSKNENFVGIIRVDLFYGKTPKIVEINADFPDGFFMHDITVKEILETTGIKISKLPDHAKIFSRLLESEGLNKKSHIFIGYNKERAFIDEFALTKIQLEKLGWKNISIGPFEKLKYKNCEFYFKNNPIKAIRRGAEISKLRKNPKLIRNLNEAREKSPFKIINNFKMRLLGHKSLLAALCDRRFHKYLAKKEIKAINTLLPKTIKLENADIQSVIKNKNLWVLKPSDLTEGEKVSIGKSMSKKQWKDRVKSGLKNPDYWILQHKISIPEETFNLINQSREEIISVPKKYDFNPHFILFKNHSEAGNILVRFSDREMLNVMRGGGLTYAFIIDNNKKL